MTMEWISNLNDNERGFIIWKTKFKMCDSIRVDTIINLFQYIMYANLANLTQYVNTI